MCMTRKINRERKKKKIYRVYPEPQRPSFTTDEVIQCAGCNEKFKLSDIKINCAGCNQFFHCKVAGTCYGSNCLETTNDGQNHRQCWCTQCVPPLPKNIEKEKREEKCICKQCYRY